MVKTMGAAAMLLHTFFITTLLFSTGSALILNYTTRGCSKHCESINCDNARTIRYGKFCGVGYTGCPNQSPCDRLDACCRQHDFCVGTNSANFPNQTCRYNLRSCLQQYLSTGASVYHGSNCTAMTVQNTVMVAMESTTYHQHVAPGSAPQTGGAPKSVSTRFLESMTTHAVFIGGMCLCVPIVHGGSSWLTII
ncbi:hypothetical protein KC19_1G339200 [Ceratodon purpureus]|uniref:Uncharacterized protein n=1 Tax=Ceratodon purpureus TaxID=3225 RepID=A0A8T0JCC9_CERPU|nr:hypothetical protein KC19_1G339200 [Ceratodon purpureus]